MDERIKELRQALGLSGEKFGKNIGLSRFAISNIENGKNAITEQTIIAICHVYNVNENWLRTGEGEMFRHTEEGFMETIRRQFNLNDFQVHLVKTYLELPDQDKDSIDHFIAACCQQTDQEEIENP